MPDAPTGSMPDAPTAPPADSMPDAPTGSMPPPMPSLCSTFTCGPSGTDPCPPCDNDGGSTDDGDKKRRKGKGKDASENDGGSTDDGDKKRRKGKGKDASE